MYKKVLLTIALFSSITCATAAQNLVSIDGSYDCLVNDLTVSANHHETGKFALKQNGNTYTVTQLNDNVQPTTNDYNIIALRSGNVLSMAYQNIKDPKIFGSEIMRISKDGRTLYGTFIYWNQSDKVNTEICKRI